MTTEEKLKEAEAELARLKRRKMLTTHDLPPAVEEPPRKSVFVSTNEPRSGPAPISLQIHHLKEEASDKRAAEILERVRGTRKGGK